MCLEGRNGVYFKVEILMIFWGGKKTVAVVQNPIQYQIESSKSGHGSIHCSEGRSRQISDFKTAKATQRKLVLRQFGSGVLKYRI